MQTCDIVGPYNVHFNWIAPIVVIHNNFIWKKTYESKTAHQFSGSGGGGSQSEVNQPMIHGIQLIINNWSNKCDWCVWIG